MAPAQSTQEQQSQMPGLGSGCPWRRELQNVRQGHQGSSAMGHPGSWSGLSAVIDRTRDASQTLAGTVDVKEKLSILKCLFADSSRDAPGC